ncbi:YbdD/YjiX family protein [Brevibacillus fulvus]|uniref:Uncharacterized short protein YbdD (DUF466 family) n=1 Tax=Brevibacillus fulvus TaxID=1125967 RepID=A0A939BSQ9_9BACL|nr:YbdD/YjiX family protein [Brevibacillus fulvus]MBM7590733.1 uncharacterized short protein YbdD (DUF466 family) [Brevibacillus fulvus]
MTPTFIRLKQAGDKWGSLLRKMSSTIKTIFGMPNYERYLAHWYAHHAEPGKQPVSEKEFYMMALHDRYEKGGMSRCC